MIDKLLMPKAYAQVLEILKHIPVEDYNKIPTEIIKNMQLNADREYKYQVNCLDNFQEQEMLKETETILAVLFRDYWATEEQRREILKKERFDLNLLEQEKRERYNPDNLFKKNTKITNTEMPEERSSTALTEYKETFFTKLKELIFKILHINK